MRKSFHKEESPYKLFKSLYDPKKKFLVNGQEDCRIMKEPIPLIEKEAHYPKKVEEVNQTNADY
jgi:hypothetical protein